MLLVALWSAVSALAAGAVVGFSGAPAPVGAAAASGAALVSLRRRPAARFAGLVLAAFALGTVAAGARLDSTDALSRLAQGAPRCSLLGTILEGAGGLGTLVSIDELVCSHLHARHPGVAVVDGAVGEPGVPVAAEGYLFPLGNDGYARARRRLGAGAAFDPTVVRTGEPSGLYALAAAIREGLRSATSDVEPQRAGLLRGLAVGDTSAIDERALGAFRASGLSHLLAVSGSNVAIVLGALAFVARRAARSSRVVLGAGGLVLFVLVVGPEPSVLRAAVMGGLALAAFARGRVAEPLHALAVALIALVAVRPALVFSVGLHLSAAATAGIVLWAPPLAARLGVLPQPIAVPLAVTLAAQAAVFPILAVVFGEVSLVAPVANLLAVPAVPPATVLAVASAVVGALWAPAGALLARAAEPFAAWILWVAERFGEPSWASAEVAPVAGYVGGAAALVAAVTTAQRYARPQP